MKNLIFLLSLSTMIVLAPSCKKDKTSEPAPTPATPTPANPVVEFDFFNVDGVQTYNISNLTYKISKDGVVIVPSTAVSTSLVVYQSNSAASSSPYDCTDLDSSLVITASTSANELYNTTLVNGQNCVLQFDLYNSGSLVNSSPLFFDGSTLGTSGTGFCIKSVGTRSVPKFDVFVKLL